MTNSSEVESLASQPHKLLILDARSYAAAVANRAKGGGCECPGKNLPKCRNQLFQQCLKLYVYGYTAGFDKL